MIAVAIVAAGALALCWLVPMPWGGAIVGVAGAALLVFGRHEEVE